MEEMPLSASKRVHFLTQWTLTETHSFCSPFSWLGLSKFGLSVSCIEESGCTKVLVVNLLRARTYIVEAK